MNGKYVFGLGGPQPEVDLDGQRLPVAALRVSQRRGEYPIVELVMDAAQVEVTGEGEITINVPGDEIRRFLDGVDPQQLEAAVFAEPSMDENPTEKTLEILKEWASAKP
jgi:hypothetical protein